MAKTITVHIKLQNNEATRPVQALSLRQGLYKILPTMEKDAKPETWEFPPGSIIRITEKNDTGKPYFIARAKS